MKFSFFSFILPLLAIFFSLNFPKITCSGNIIKETCKKSAETDSNIDYNFCTAALQSAQKSDSADLYELGAISIELIQKNVTSTRNYITELLKNKSLDSYATAHLTDCQELYSDAIPTLKQAYSDYESKKYGSANVELSSVMDASSTCEDGFKEKKGAVSPLGKRNNYVFQLTAIALSILNMNP